MTIMKMFQKKIEHSFPESHLRDVTFAVAWNVVAADDSTSVNRP